MGLGVGVIPRPPKVKTSATTTRLLRPLVAATALLLAVGIPLWLARWLIAAVVFGRDSVVVDQGLFFSGSALITFGGAYAVLAFVAQQAVTNYGWVTTTDMVRGLALAETTPGPLIMVVQFVAFVGVVGLLA